MGVGRETKSVHKPTEFLSEYNLSASMLNAALSIAQRCIFEPRCGIQPTQQLLDTARRSTRKVQG